MAKEFVKIAVDVSITVDVYCCPVIASNSLLPIILGGRGVIKR